MTPSIPPTLTAYRGRFAPSPTGPLHFGSLVAALGSFLDARANGGEWLVRIEDLDPPREIPGAADHILSTLDAFGFEWDGAVLYQSSRHDAYQAALTALEAAGASYRCRCTRKEIAQALARRPDPVGPSDPSTCTHQESDQDSRELIYPGTCRGAAQPVLGAITQRIKVDNAPIEFVDGLQGRVEQALTKEIGDFVLRRADGLFAYQLAVVVDDAAQGITDVVRGADLLYSTPRQIYLGRMLGHHAIRYLHLPVVVNAAGEKLSKQTRAAPIDSSTPVTALCAALRFLGHAPPEEASKWAHRDVLAWGVGQWRRDNLPRSRAATYPD